MADCAEQYFHAWCGVFNENETKKLLCIWHVDRAWRKSLQQHISDQQERVEVYHQLRVLLLQRNESEFTTTLQQFMSHVYDRYEKFFNYFNTQYVPHVTQWATCYRIGTVVSTNMFAESFHRVLKVVYFNKKQNRRVDYLIHTLLCIARNIIYDTLRKTEMNASTHRKCEINKRHKIAQEVHKSSSSCVLQSCGINVEDGIP